MSSPAEQLCLESVEKGILADLTTLAEDQRVLDHAFIRDLVCGRAKNTGKTVGPLEFGVRIKGLCVKQDLDLSHVDCSFPVAFTDGHFHGTVCFYDTGLRSLHLDRCVFEKWVDASSLETRSDFSASDAEFKDWLSLWLAEIGGDARLEGAKVSGVSEIGRAAGLSSETQGVALLADGAEVGGSVYLCATSSGNRFEASGTVRLPGAKIGGQLSCMGGSFQNPEGVALFADGIEVPGGLFLRALDKDTRFEAQGEVRLLGAKIGGQMSCMGGSFQKPEGVALFADGMEVTGDVFLLALDKDTRFEAQGTVRLPGAKIGGQLNCEGGSFENSGGNALLADQMEVTGSVFLRALDKNTRFEARGTVRLHGAKVGGQLSCIGGSFQNSGGDAFLADRIEVGTDVLFHWWGSQFLSHGRVSLVGAKIKGKLDCTGSKFVNQTRGQDALDCEAIEVGWVLIRKKKGLGPSIDGNVSFEGAKISGLFKWQEVGGTHDLDIRRAETDTIQLFPVDVSTAESDINWERYKNWKLSGLRYEALSKPELAATGHMLKFLQSCDAGQYLPQPYRQLFRTLRDAGHAEEATRVAIEMRKEAFEHERKNLSWLHPKWLLSWIGQGFSWLTGHGYSPWRAVKISFCLWLGGFAVYAYLVHMGVIFTVMGPVDGDLLAALQKQPQLAWQDQGPPFAAWLYSLDRFLPVVDFGQASFYRPRGTPGVGWWLNSLDWLLTISGWLLSILLAGATTGLTRKIDSDE